MSIQFVERSIALEGITQEDFIKHAAGASSDPFVAKIQYPLLVGMTPGLLHHKTYTETMAFPDEAEMVFLADEKIWTYAMKWRDPELPESFLPDEPFTNKRLVEITYKTNCDWFIHRECAVFTLRRVEFKQIGPEQYERIRAGGPSTQSWVFRQYEDPMHKVNAMVRFIHAHFCCGAVLGVLPSEHALEIFGEENPPELSAQQNRRISGVLAGQIEPVY